MLGFSPIASRPISGSPFGLIGYTAAMVTVGTLTFSGSARWGSFLTAHATGLVRFSGSARWTTRNALTATSGITFGGDALLKFAGRPIVFYAVPERHEFIGLPERLTFTAKADNFTFRGMR